MTKIFIAGDYHVYGEFDEFIKSYPNHELFSEGILELIRDHDYRIFNLEDPITQSRDGCKKSGPYGVGSPESLVPISKAGFDLATFATNHTYDMKNKGISDTITACKEKGIEVVGAGLMRDEAAQAKRISQNGVSFSILNYARKEFNCANEFHGGANPFNLIDAFHDIQNEKKRSDFVIVIIHDGMDIYELPTPLLQKKMRFLTEANPDLIILHHAQKYSGFEEFNRVPIFYGLGNMLHLTKNDFDRYGIALSVELNINKGLSFRIVPMLLDTKAVVVNLLQGEEKDCVIKNIERLSGIIKHEKELIDNWKMFLKSKKLSYMSSILGLNPMIYRALKRLPALKIIDGLSLMLKRRLLAILNIMRCSVHREASIDILEELFQDEG